MDSKKMERLLLANQYKMLNQLFPNQGYDQIEESIRKGFYDYDSLVEDIKNVVEKEYLKETEDALDLYNVLQRSVEILGSQSPVTEEKVLFPGYGVSGELESSLLDYAIFLRKTGKWSFTKARREDLKSSSKMRAIYIKQVEIWKKLGKKTNLSAEDIQEILK
mgnify:CR=1 FL=1